MEAPTGMEYGIRPAGLEDCADIMRMIRELAEYEKLADKVLITEEVLKRDGFGDNPFYKCFVVELCSGQKSNKGTGMGKKLISKVAEVCVEQNFCRLQLAVLDWNLPAMDFYLKKGAVDLTTSEGWHMMRFQGEALKGLALNETSH